MRLHPPHPISPTGGPLSATGLVTLLEQLRPRVHRYCARMVGSSVEGEDVLQEAYLRAVAAFERAHPHDPTSWVFTIAHRVALDALRKRARLELTPLEEEPNMGVTPDETLALDASLRTLMELPTRQRAVVVLADVLGHRNDEICEIVGLTPQATKALLHRGRARLRELGALRETCAHPPLPEGTRRLVEQYARRFNARDFDAVRALLAEEVRIEVVGRARLVGRDDVAANYLHNYARTHDWHFAPGMVDGRPAMIALDAARAPVSFVVLAFEAGLLLTARDFRYARYALDGAVIELA